MSQGFPSHCVGFQVEQCASNGNNASPWVPACAAASSG
jgi:hypothetical protein